MRGRGRTAGKHSAPRAHTAWSGSGSFILYASYFMLHTLYFIQVLPTAVSVAIPTAVFILYTGYLMASAVAIIHSGHHSQWPSFTVAVTPMITRSQVVSTTTTVARFCLFSYSCPHFILYTLYFYTLYLYFILLPVLVLMPALYKESIVELYKVLYKV